MPALLALGPSGCSDSSKQQRAESPQRLVSISRRTCLLSGLPCAESDPAFFLVLPGETPASAALAAPLRLPATAAAAAPLPPPPSEPDTCGNKNVAFCCRVYIYIYIYTSAVALLLCMCTYRFGWPQPRHQQQQQGGCSTRQSGRATERMDMPQVRVDSWGEPACRYHPSTCGDDIMAPRSRGAHLPPPRR